jgi:hypothetical protein
MRFATGPFEALDDHMFLGSHASWFGELEKKQATIIRINCYVADDDVKMFAVRFLFTSVAAESYTRGDGP